MAQIHIYGDMYDRFDGPQRFEDTVRDDLLAQIDDLRCSENEDALDDLMEDLEFKAYDIIRAIIDQCEMDDENLFVNILNGEKVGVFAEEIVFGVGSSPDEAKLAYLQVTDDMRG